MKFYTIAYLYTLALSTVSVDASLKGSRSLKSKGSKGEESNEILKIGKSMPKPSAEYQDHYLVSLNSVNTVS